MNKKINNKKIKMKKKINNKKIKMNKKINNKKIKIKKNMNNNKIKINKKTNNKKIKVNKTIMNNNKITKIDFLYFNLINIWIFITRYIQKNFTFSFIERYYSHNNNIMALTINKS